MTLLDRLDGLHSAQDLRPAALATPAVTEEAADLREAFEERAGILEYDAAIPRSDAELEAARITATLATRALVRCGRARRRLDASMRKSSMTHSRSEMKA